MIIPCEVKNHDIAKTAGYPVAVPEIVAPQHAYEAGENEAHKKSEPRICSRGNSRLLVHVLLSLYVRLLHRAATLCAVHID